MFRCMNAWFLFLFSLVSTHTHTHTLQPARCGNCSVTWLNIVFIVQNPVILSPPVSSPLLPVQWKREQDFDLQLLERAVQGEEAQGVRSVQGEERPPEHNERLRSHSDEWLTFCSTAMSPPTNEVDLEPLDYDVDLNKEVQELISASSQIIGAFKLKFC